MRTPYCSAAYYVTPDSALLLKRITIVVVPRRVRETFFVPCQIAVAIRGARVYVLAGFRFRPHDPASAVRVTGPDSVHVQGVIVSETKKTIIKTVGSLCDRFLEIPFYYSPFTTSVSLSKTNTLVATPHASFDVN